MKYCMAIGLLGSMTFSKPWLNIQEGFVMRTEMVSSMKVKNDCIGSLFPMG